MNRYPKACEAKAREIIEISARSVACLTADLTAALGLERVIIGGGVGLAEGYLDLIRSCLSELPPLFRIELAQAALGAASPLYGALHQARQLGEER